MGDTTQQVGDRVGAGKLVFIHPAVRHEVLDGLTKDVLLDGVLQDGERSGTSVFGYEHDIRLRARYAIVGLQRVILYALFRTRAFTGQQVITRA